MAIWYRRIGSMNSFLISDIVSPLRKMKEASERTCQFGTHILEREAGTACMAFGNDNNSGRNWQMAYRKAKAFTDKPFYTVAYMGMPCLAGDGDSQPHAGIICFGLNNKKKEMPGVQPASHIITLGIFGSGTNQTFLRQFERNCLLCGSSFFGK